ncbi:30S ribosomal protein 3, chloroplastic [Heracleum sosnowskyi]|uniref:30S ribosomal protein 3, chloroplastic n=1 Tax=Heracleum sosnowskyi TaxID=360622 RepID=A0AAD8I8X4_9APIA|nr:30S ribosomal protein 3, chloroplastic [Heracleum sosnowskyi]
MLSMSVQTGIKGTFTCPTLPSCNVKHQAFSVQHSSNNFVIKSKPFRRIRSLTAEAGAVVSETPVDGSASESVPAEEPEKLKVGVKEVEKPTLVLKFIWMEKNIGLALDQKIPGHGTIPLSPYYFWPRKDAWEELKTTLESKPWISQKKMIILLNQATDIINLWQQSGGNLSGQQ